MLPVDAFLHHGLTLRGSRLLGGLLLLGSSLQHRLTVRDTGLLGSLLLRDTSIEHRVPLQPPLLRFVATLKLLWLAQHRRIGSGRLRLHGSRCIRREALRLGFVVVAALIIPDRLVLITRSGAVRAGEIPDGIGHVGVGIEQAAGVAAVPHGLSGAEPDLHKAVIAGAHDAGIALALDMDDTPNQGFGHAVGGGMLGDEVIVLAGAGVLPGNRDRRR